MSFKKYKIQLPVEFSKPLKLTDVKNLRDNETKIEIKFSNLG